MQNNIAAELFDIADRNIIDTVNLKLIELKTPFESLKSEHLRFKQYEKYCGFGMPEAYEIGINITF